VRIGSTKCAANLPRVRAIGEARLDRGDGAERSPTGK